MSLVWSWNLAWPTDSEAWGEGSLNTCMERVALELERVGRIMLIPINGNVTEFDQEATH
jgi:hypothetical protein